MQNRTDEQLVADYLKGDEESLNILVGRYLKPIYSFVYRYIRSAGDAEDVTQEAFIKAWSNLRKFDRQKKFKTWIFSIAKNTSIDWLRKKKAIPFRSFETENGGNRILDTLLDPSPLPDELLERADLKRSLTSAIDRLSPKYQVVLFLRYNDHFTFREIAGSLGIPLHTVKSQHRRALISLKKLLTES